MAMQFSTERLIGIPMAEADEILFCDLYCDAQTMQFIGPPLSRGRAARAFRGILKLTSHEPVDQIFFTLSERRSGEAIGICSIQHLDRTRRRTEAGIMIGSKRRSVGFATEGLLGLIRFAFEHLPVDEVWVQIAVDHTIVEKLVIGVGLVRGAETSAAGGQSAMRIWSAHRHSWPHSTASRIPGDSNVGRH